jgi:hypothetical protein
MKALVVLIIGANFAFAQNDTLLEALKYYPLQNDNYWEYCTYIYELPFYVDSVFYSVEVTGDTTLSNNINYKILLNKNIPDNGYKLKIYERMDSSTACVYRFTTDTFFINNEYLADSLFARPGDYFHGSVTGFYSWAGGLSTYCADEYEDTILLIPTSIKEFYDQSGIPQTDYFLAKGFGFVEGSSYEFGGGITYLRYAKIDGIEYGTQITAIDNAELNRPGYYFLYQNYPNPFNPVTNIAYSIPQTGIVTLKVYDVLGNEIRTLVNEENTAGRYNIIFDGSNLASGIYFYVIRSGDFIRTRKMVLLR